VPGSYRLGIVFDGPVYQAGATSRDRDRLRPAELARRGWRLHRIWAQAWAQRRDEELARLRKALQAK
jgi:hypothetical protein